jgi:hypothetical protein
MFSPTKDRDAPLFAAEGYYTERPVSERQSVFSRQSAREGHDEPERPVGTVGHRYVS